jgi:hypothetical protein
MRVSALAYIVGASASLLLTTCLTLIDCEKYFSSNECLGSMCGAIGCDRFASKSIGAIALVAL